MNSPELLLVIKIGGGEGLDLPAVCDDLATLARTHALVVVHGVSAMMNQMCQKLGIEVQSLTSPSGHSSRYTPPPVRDVYVQAAAVANAQIASALRQRGVQAQRFDGKEVVIAGKRKSAIRALHKGRVRIIRDDCTGSINSVSVGGLHSALDNGRTPVLPPLAKSADGMLNIDGDRAGAALASALAADSLVILSNVKGLYRDISQESSLVGEVSAEQIDQALDWAQGRMKRKIIAAREALEGGVRQVIISDGRVANPVSEALRGAGTRFSL